MMNLILISASTITGLLFLMVLGKRIKTKTDYLLAVWLLVSAVEFLLKYLIEIEFYYQYPHILGLLHHFPLLHAGLLFWYISMVINGKLETSYKIIIALPLAISLLLSWRFLFLDGESKLNLYLESIRTPPSYQPLIILLYGLIVGFLLWSSAAKLWRYNKRWALVIRNPVENGIVWLKWLVSGYSIIWSMMISASFLYALYGVPDTSKGFGLIVFAIFMISLGYVGLQRTGIFSGSDVMANTGSENIFPYQNWKVFKSYAKSGLKDEQASLYLSKLEQLMKNKRLYLNSNLSIQSLANYIDISPNHLSQVIN